jgi:hypothetical protein
MEKFKEYVGECTQEVIDYLKHNLREIDEYECRAASGMPGAKCLQLGFEKSIFIRAIFSGDEPLGVYGVNPVKSFDNMGIAWMLGTDNLPKAGVLLMDKRYIATALEYRPMLYNYVSERNRVSIKWLKRVGFTVGDPVPYGPTKENFCLFHISRKEK